MKSLMCLVILCCSSLCWGWNCSVPGQVRVQVPTGTVGNGTGDGSGQVVVDGGLTFICEKLPVAGSPKETNISNTNSNTNSNANTNNNSNTTSVNNTLSNNVASTNNNSLSQKQQQQQNQTQSASATGGNASSTSNATGGTSSASATGNGDGSNNTTSNTTVEASKIPVSQAYAPTALPTVPCFKGFGAGVQTMALGGSFGGGKIDPNCAILETARSYGIAGSWLAYCKVMATDKYAKQAGVTVEDCLKRYVPPAPIVVAPPAPAQQQPQVIIIQTPVAAPAPLPVYHEEVTVVAPKPVVKKKPIHHMRPDCQNVVQLVCKGEK